MRLLQFLEELSAQPGYRGQIAHIEQIPPRDATFGELEKPLPAELERCLGRQGLLPLYAHQAQAANKSRDGKNVMVCTSSASGKSLCYNIPAIEELLSNRNSRALYLFPTKALAQDQLRSLHELFGSLLGSAAFSVFDGDTPRSERAEIRRRARLVLTNPDMLHIGILPNHQAWSRLLRNLKYVIVDEAHVYRGVFGSHVSGVLRRLRRLCQYYGASPRFICASATIANPGEHAGRLVGLPFEVVAGDGSPHGGKVFAFWNPPITDEAKTARRSANSEAAELFAGLVQRGIRTLAFTRTRRLTELIYNYARKRLSEIDGVLGERIKPYRAGYLAEERRRIEHALFSGELIGVVATTALELGIDIGDLEATVLTGYPGSIASTWQQAGRSGRGKDESLSILIALDNPLDQYFMRHPEYFFGRNFENALVDPANKYILKGHLACAAWEMPLDGSDEEYFSSILRHELAALAEQGVLRERGGKWFLSTSIAYPAQGINIRSTSGENFALIDSSNSSLLEMVETIHAFTQAHRGAVYLHQGRSYLVRELDLSTRTAHLEPADISYYTQAKELTDLSITREIVRRRCGEVEVCLGEVEVSTTVVGFKKKAQFTEEVLGEESLELPPYRFPTVALWFDLPAGAVGKIAEGGLDFAGGLHAAEHAAIGMLPLFALCDRNDIGGVSTTFHPDTGRAGIFIYDAHPGGIGIAERGYNIIEELWAATLKLISECPCQEGCPSCIQSPKCGNNNQPLDKAAAIVLLEGLVSLSSPTPGRSGGLRG